MKKATATSHGSSFLAASEGEVVGERGTDQALLQENPFGKVGES
jgi:hypothetical protein